MEAVPTVRWIYFKNIIRVSFFAVIAGALITLLINHAIQKSAEGNMYYMVSDAPSSDVALVLGTAQYLSRGVENPFFTYRMDAAAELYHAGKVKKILVSGDNSTAAYNEPRDMLNALIKRGVCPDDIALDYAGFRTFDSMVRAREVFGLSRCIVVSQEFHCERAIYIAESKGITVHGFVAKIPAAASQVMLREYLARVNAFLDCHVLRTEPHFLGEKIDILATL
jgi:SanA protein